MHRSKGPSKKPAMVLTACVMVAMGFAALNASYNLTNAQLGDGDEERYRNSNSADDPGKAIGRC
jgi:hypothetical protein